jgi:hypothetical protein
LAAEEAMSEALPLEELLASFRYWNEKTGKPLGNQLTHEANLEMARRLKALSELFGDAEECEMLDGEQAFYRVQKAHAILEGKR